MNINDLLDVVEYGIKYYKDKTHGRKFGLIEYFSLTDIEPKDLANSASCRKRRGAALRLRTFAEDYFLHLKEVKVEQRLNHFHSVQGHEMTPEDKLTVMDKIKAEDFPLRDGLYDQAVYRYVTKGIDSISKEQIREDVITAYNEATGKKITITKEQPKVLVK